MDESGHGAVEFALGVGLLLLPVAILVLGFGPWSERRVLAEAAAAEAALGPQCSPWMLEPAELWSPRWG